MSQSNKLFGLVYENNSQIPLKKIDFDVNIIHNLANVTLTQEYINTNYNRDIEAIYYFPIPQDACFDSFEAKFGKTELKGVIKKKEEAKKDYESAVSQGIQAAYAQIDDACGDIMKVNIGNIRYKEPVIIKYSYIQKLSISMNKFWSFSLLSSITPRYNPGSTNSKNLLENYPMVKPGFLSSGYTWNINIEIQSPQPIKSIESFNYPVSIDYKDERHRGLIKLKDPKSFIPSKDFNILYCNGAETQQDCMLASFKESEKLNRYCAMCTFFPNYFKNVSEKEFLEKAKESAKPKMEVSMKETRGEYIFLIDRSGSMSGTSIKVARETLVYFLKSLPKNSYFNVVSFGSSYKYLFNESQEYSQEWLDSAIQSVSSFEANFGGTEVAQPLQNIFDKTPKRTYPRTIFLLTDGAVSNTSKVIDLIEKNNTKARVFTVGIGNCSRELIHGAAKAGKGKYEEVYDTSNLAGKVISLLDDSMVPCCDDFSIEGLENIQEIDAVSPEPSSVGYLLRDQELTFFVFLNEKFKETKKLVLKLKAFDSISNSYNEYPIEINIDNLIDNQSIAKMGIHSTIKQMEAIEEGMSINKSGADVYYAAVSSIKQDLEILSISYGILCKKTAFYCENLNAKDIKPQLIEPQKIVVPAVSQEDYIKLGGGQERFRSLASMPRSSNNLMKAQANIDSIRDQMSQNIACMIERSETLDSLECKSNSLSRQSMSFKSSSAKPQSSEGFLSKTASAFGSVFSSIGSGIKSIGGVFSTKKKSLPENKSASQYESSTIQYDEPAPKLYQQSEKISKESSPKPQGSKSDLDFVLKQQKFEGCWENSKELAKIVANGVDIAKLAAKKGTEKIWITVLVMIWLENSQSGNKDIWNLMFRKAKEWISDAGFEYETLKKEAKN